MYGAICVKRAGSISNLGSRGGQTEHWEVIIHCTSTRLMEDSPLYRCGCKMQCVIASTGETMRSFITPVADYLLYATTIKNVTENYQIFCALLYHMCTNPSCMDVSDRV